MTSFSNKVLTIGSFDILHFGHIDFLRKCQTLGDLTVGVNTDEFIKQFKPAPTLTLQERVYALEQAGFKTVVNSSAGRELIESLKPEVLVVGSDWARKDYYQQINVSQTWLDKRNIVMAYVPYIQKYHISSSEIKKRVRDA